MDQFRRPTREMKIIPLYNTEFDEIVYLFQGGGALGAYQVGVYQALTENGYAPDWMVGISIGAINASIIAGNPQEKRLEKMNQFWQAITHSISPWIPNSSSSEKHQQNLLTAYNICSAYFALVLGQRNFFKPSAINPWFIQKENPDKISFYDTSDLKKILMEVVDFDYLNSGHIRLSLGTVNVKSGRLKFFDNRKCNIQAEHIMASCALPPGFPAIEIEGEYYWDGGLYSNTPLISVINDLPHKSRLCFLVDLFESTGLIPHTMDDVLERAKDITYAGHLDIVLDYYDLHLFIQKKIATCLNKLPSELKKDPDIQELARFGDSHNVHIAKIVYRSSLQDLHSKDYEFSNFSAKRRMEEGYQHTNELLLNPKWWRDQEENVGTVVHPMAKDMHIVLGSSPGKKRKHYDT